MLDRPNSVHRGNGAMVRSQTKNIIIMHSIHYNKIPRESTELSTMTQFYSTGKHVSGHFGGVGAGIVTGRRMVYNRDIQSHLVHY